MWDSIYSAAKYAKKWWSDTTESSSVSLCWLCSHCILWFGYSVSNFSKHSMYLAIELFKSYTIAARFCSHNNVATVSAGKKMLIMSRKYAKTALNRISFNRISHRLCYC